MRTHTWETPEVHQIWTVNQASQNDWPKETQRKYHIKITQTVTRARLRDSPSVHMYCTLFPPRKHFTCFTTFCLCGNSFLQTRRARALVTHHWQAPCVFTLSPSLQHLLHSTSHWCIAAPPPSWMLPTRAARKQHTDLPQLCSKHSSIYTIVNPCRPVSELISCFLQVPDTSTFCNKSFYSPKLQMNLPSP